MTLRGPLELSSFVRQCIQGFCQLRAVWDKLMILAGHTKELLDSFKIGGQWEILYCLDFVGIHLDAGSRFNVSQKLEGGLEEVALHVNHQPHLFM